MKRVVVLLEKNVSFVHIQNRKRRSLIASDKAIICIFDEGGITRVVHKTLYRISGVRGWDNSAWYKGSRTTFH